MKAILLSAGGTGGHVLPAILIAKEIKRKGPNQRIVILGVGTPIEQKLLANTGIEYLIVKSRGVVGTGVLSKLKSIYSHFLNYSAVKKILKDNEVVNVLGFGGYPSFMPLLVARMLGLRTYLFEQNGKAGLANKLASLFVNQVFSVPYAEGLLSSKITHILNPVRAEIRNLKTQEETAKEDQPFNILILGGSQGAVGMNTLVVEVLKKINDPLISILHQTGERDFERVRSSYEGISSELVCSPFIDNMAEAYQQANIVISRAGAGTYGEILAVEKPCIFIPLPISRGHQYYNVKHLVSSGGAFVVNQNDLREASNNLESLIRKLKDNLNYRAEIRQNLSSFKAQVAGGAGEEVLSKVLLEDLV